MCRFRRRRLSQHCGWGKNSRSSPANPDRLAMGVWVSEAEAHTEPLITRTILYDLPSESDKFSGGGHQRTAAALARTIEQFDDGDRAIGLEGSWGSGKSSIVKMAEAKLRHASHKHAYHVFTYDLWANQTSHFRRSFLEALLSWASQEFSAKSSIIKKRQDQVRSKKQTIRTFHFKRFNWFGFLTVFLLYFSPLLYLWLGPTAFRESGNSMLLNGTKIAWIVIGIYLCLLLLHALQSLPQKGKSTTRWGDAFSQALSIFSKDAEIKNIDQSIRDEDPTQYEFNETFRRIVSDLLLPGERLIVVFDNIDRLPPERIPDTWSEVRGAFYGDACATQVASIIAIVPYAEPIALEALSGAKGDEREGSSERTTEDGYLQGDVFRKSFDVIFNVAPPVLSDVWAFFSDRFRDAVGTQVANDAIGRVYRIFRLHVEKTDRPVTPRQIISFINDTTNFWEQWQGMIPIETVAVYVVHKKLLLRNPACLRREGAIEPRMVQHANQPNIYRHLAALAYNVEPDLAFQVLSYDAIKKALLEKDPLQLQELANSAATNGFVDILHDVVDENAEQWSKSAVAELATAISNVALLTGNSADLAYSKESFLKAVKRIGNFDLQKLESLSRLWAVVGFCNVPELRDLLQSLLVAIGRGLPESDMRSFEHGQIWIHAIGLILDEVDKAHGSETAEGLSNAIVIPTGPEFAVGVAYDCDQTNYHLRQFKLTTQSEPIVESLASYAKGGQQFSYAYPELEHLFDVSQNVRILTVIAASIKSEILKPSSDELRWRFENLGLVCSQVPSENKQGRAQIRELYGSGALVYFAHQEWEHTGEIGNPVTTLAIWLAMREYGVNLPAIPNSQQLPTFGNISARQQWFEATYQSREIADELVTPLSDRVQASADMDLVLAHACEEPGGRALFKRVIQETFARDGAEAPSATLLIRNFNAFRSVFGSQFDGFLAIVGRLSDENYWEVPAFENATPDMVRVGGHRTEQNWVRFLRKLDDWLTSLSAENWQKALREEGGGVDILIARNSMKPLHLPAAHFSEPLMAISLEIISGQFDPMELGRDYGALLSALPSNSQARFKREFYERHDTYTKSMGAALRHLSTVMEGLPFRDSPDKTVERYIMPLIKDASHESDAFIERHQEEFKSCMKSAGATSTGVVREFLDGLANEEAAEERVLNLRRQLGIKQPRAKASKNA
jgi:hypothetical protein